MANKAVPQAINGAILHPKAKQRTNRLLAELETAGVGPLTQTKSGIDRLRLVASAFFALQDELAPVEKNLATTEEVGADVAEVVDNLR